MNVADLLAQHGLKLSAYPPRQYAVTCPRCSARRSRAHQNTKCLGVKIDEKGACWRCNHCNWSGPEKGNGGNGKAEAIEATYDYVENGEFRFQKVRYPKGREPRFLLRTRDANGGWKWGGKEGYKAALAHRRDSGGGRQRAHHPDRGGREGRGQPLAHRTAGDLQFRRRSRARAKTEMEARV